MTPLPRVVEVDKYLDYITNRVLPDIQPDLLKAPELPKVLFAAGVGVLGFSFLRLVFFGIYQDNLIWFNFWEELTELMYMVGVGFALWTFRRGLLHTRESE